MSIRSELKDLYYEISADIEHGECFYDQGMFRSFYENLNKMKELSLQLYMENALDREDDEDE